MNQIHELPSSSINSIDNIPNALRERHNRTYPIERMDDKVQLNRELLEHCPPCHPSRDSLLYDLAESLFLLYLHTGTMTQRDVDQAVELIEEYLKLTSPVYYKEPRFTLLYALAIFRARGGVGI